MPDLLFFHFVCNACSSSETQRYQSHQFGLQSNPSTVLSICTVVCFGLVCAAVVFSISILKQLQSVCNHTIAPVPMEKSWWTLSNKSHKIYPQVRVIKGIALKCRHFKLKWKPLLNIIQVGFIYYIYIYIYIYILILNKHVNHHQHFLTANIMQICMLWLF